MDGTSDEEQQEREDEQHRPWRRPTIEIAWISPAALFREGMPQPPLWHIRREVVEAAFAEAEREAAAADWKPAPSGAAVDLLPLWILADELARQDGGTPERRWLELLDAIRRGELGRDGCAVLFHDGVTRGVQALTINAGTLFGAPAEGAANWTADDYRAAAGDHAWMLQLDPEGRLGLAVARGEFERWRAQQQHSEAAGARPAPTAAAALSTISQPASKARRGPAPGAIDRYATADRALYTAIEELMNRGSSLTAATETLSDAGKIAGIGIRRSLAKRLARRFSQDRKRGRDVR